MKKKADQTSGAEEFQVFELTMDNPEDQDELNRQLRKPGEPDRGPSGMTGNAVNGESTTKSPNSSP
jgi:hypothetical protein